MVQEQVQSYKWILEYCILLILVKEDAYITDIIQQLKNHRIITVEGSIYPLLTRMKNNGLLHYRWEESQQGPPRKYYCITAKGKTEMKYLYQNWTALCHSVSQLESTYTLT